MLECRVSVPRHVSTQDQQIHPPRLAQYGLDGCDDIGNRLAFLRRFAERFESGDYWEHGRKFRRNSG